MKSVLERLRKFWEWIAAAVAYLASVPGRLEQDARNRERRRLKDELADFDKLREYIKCREPVVLDRLGVLDKDDIAATVPASSYGNRWNHSLDASGYFRLQAFKK